MTDHTLQAHCKCYHVPAALHRARSSEKNKWPYNETRRKMTHPLFQSENEAYWKRVTEQTKSLSVFHPPIRQPWNGLCQNTRENKAHRVVRATVKCYGLNSNWQSGWARQSRLSRGSLCFQLAGFCLFHSIFWWVVLCECVCVLTS